VRKLDSKLLGHAASIRSNSVGFGYQIQTQQLGVGPNSNWVLMEDGPKVIGFCCQPDPTMDITQGMTPRVYACWV